MKWEEYYKKSMFKNKLQLIVLTLAIIVAIFNWDSPHLTHFVLGILCINIIIIASKLPDAYRYDEQKIKDRKKFETQYNSNASEVQK